MCLRLYICNLWLTRSFFICSLTVMAYIQQKIKLRRQLPIISFMLHILKDTQKKRSTDRQKKGKNKLHAKHNKFKDKYACIYSQICSWRDRSNYWLNHITAKSDCKHQTRSSIQSMSIMRKLSRCKSSTENIDSTLASTGR